MTDHRKGNAYSKGRKPINPTTWRVIDNTRKQRPLMTTRDLQLARAVVRSQLAGYASVSIENGHTRRIIEHYRRGQLQNPKSKRMDTKR